MGNAFVMASLPPKSQRTYSTAEQWTGEYCVGKDGVARKVYSRIVYDNAPGGSPHKIDLGVRIVDLIDFSCFSEIAYDNGEAYTIPVPFYGTPSKYALSYLDEATQTSNSKLHYGATGYNAAKTHWVLRYTKEE